MANTYKVYFYGNGGSVSPSSKTVTVGERYGELATATRANYIFAGWFTKSTGGDEVTSDMVVALTSNQSLYAHWTGVPFTVTSIVTADVQKRPMMKTSITSTTVAMIRGVEGILRLLFSRRSMTTIVLHGNRRPAGRRFLKLVRFPGWRSKEAQPL